MREIAKATDRRTSYVQVARERYASALAEQDAPAECLWLVNDLFTTVLDGRNAHLTDGV